MSRDALLLEYAMCSFRWGRLVERTVYSRRTGSALGQMFFAGFGTLWMMAWCLQRHGVDWSLLALILIAGASLFLRAWCDFRAFARLVERNGDTATAEAEQSRKRIFRWINATQWLTLLAANFGLNAWGHPEWVTPVGILIVGVHLLPLARLFRAPRHNVTGLALIAVALAYPWMVHDGSHYSAGDFATGAILWLSTLYGFLRGHLGEGSAVIFVRQQGMASEVR
jgi:hypothetical protein